MMRVRRGGRILARPSWLAMGRIAVPPSLASGDGGRSPASDGRTQHPLPTIARKRRRSAVVALVALFVASIPAGHAAGAIRVATIATPTTECTIAGQRYADSSLCGGQLKIGWDGTRAFRSLLRFDVGSKVPANAQILDARVSMWLKQSNATGATPVETRALSRSWSNLATWNRYDGSGLWGSAGGDFRDALYGRHDTSGINTNTWENHFFDAALIDGWLSGKVPNHGLLFKAANETQDAVLVYNGTSSSSLYKPGMDVYYEPLMGARGTATYVSAPLNEPSPDAPLSDETLGGPSLIDDVNVDIASGNLLVRQIDRKPGLGGGEVTRYYNSLNGKNSAAFSSPTSLGTGWSLAQGPEVRLERFGRGRGSVAFYGPSGAVIRFDPNGSGGFVAANGFDGSLIIKENGHAVVTSEEDGATYEFTGLDNCRLAHYTGPEGGRVSFTYSGPSWESSWISSAKDLDGQVSRYTAIEGTPARISRVDSPDGEARKYSYNADSLLASYEDPAGRTTTYEYNSSRLMTALVQPDGTRHEFTYGGAWEGRQVQSVTRRSAGAEPVTTRFTYGPGQTAVEQNGASMTYWYTDGRVTRAVQGSDAPTMTVSGALSDAQGTSLDPGNYSLTVGARPSGTVDHGGVESISVDLDGEQVAVIDEPCGDGTCSRTLGWTLDTSTLATGQHVVEIYAHTTRGDHVERRFTFGYIDPEGPEPAPSEAPEPTAEELRDEATAFRRDFGLNADAEHVAAVAGDPGAQVAVKDYGVPLTPSELAEVRLQDDVQTANDVIDNYGAETAPDSYADQYMEYSEPGGLVHVGFKDNVDLHRARLQEIFRYPERLRVHQTAFGRRELINLADRIATESDALVNEGIPYTGSGFDATLNRVVIEVETRTPDNEEALKTRYGPAVVVEEAPIATAAAPSSRFRPTVPKYAGQQIKLTPRGSVCTLGYGAFGEFYTVKKVRFPLAIGPLRFGVKLKRARRFFLTAGHCTYRDDQRRWTQGGVKSGGVRVGHWKNGAAADIGLLTLAKRRYFSKQIFVVAGREKSVGTVQAFDQDDVGDKICYSAAATKHKCGKLRRISFDKRIGLRDADGTIVASRLQQALRLMDRECRQGDSGGPVWKIDGARAKAAGLIAAGNPGRCYYTHINHGINILRTEYDIEDLGIAVAK